jgi:shikimate kinase
MNPESISLIGYRGTGKSTVARHLALRLGWVWVDADVEVELRAGKSIAAIFADDGEAAFRNLESVVVADLCRRQRAVLALGGGAVLREANRAAIGGCRTEVERLLAERTPIYAACATLEVDTDGKAPAAIADEIVATLGLVQ